MISPAPPGSSGSAAPAGRSTSRWSRRPASRSLRPASPTGASASPPISARGFGGAEGGIAAALATGDQGGIPEADAEAMRRSGLAHLLSVSGLHLTAVVGAVMLLTLKLLALSPALALALPARPRSPPAPGALAGIAYTLLTGAEVPTVRSCIAALLVLAGIALGREALTLRLVAVGALVVLLLWPESLPGASFQMSFAAIVAIVALHENPRARAWFSRRDEGWPAKRGSALLALVLTGLAVELALMPIALFHFHKAGLYGALANVVAIPLTTFVIMPLEALALLFDLAGLGAPFWWLTGPGARPSCSGFAHAAAAAPGAVALLPAMPPAAFALIVAGGLWICLWRTRWRRYGPRSRRRRRALGPRHARARSARHRRRPPSRPAHRRRPAGPAPRPSAGDYVRDTLAELRRRRARLSASSSASRSPPAARTSAPPNIDRGGRRWRILATRTRHFVRWDEMIARLRRGRHRRRRPAAAARLRAALAPRRPHLPAPHRRPRRHPRRPAGRHGRGAGRPPSLGGGRRLQIR